MTGTQNLGEPGGATPTISIIRRIMDVKRKKRINSGTQYALSPADSDGRTLSDEQQKADGEFVYIIEMTENNEIEPSSPQDSQNSGRNGVPNSSNNIVQNDGEDVNPRFSLSPADDSGRELTQEQRDFFRNTKAVTRDGRVMPL